MQRITTLFALITLFTACGELPPSAMDGIDAETELDVIAALVDADNAPRLMDANAALAALNIDGDVVTMLPDADADEEEEVAPLEEELDADEDEDEAELEEDTEAEAEAVHLAEACEADPEACPEPTQNDGRGQIVLCPPENPDCCEDLPEGFTCVEA